MKQTIKKLVKKGLGIFDNNRPINDRVTEVLRQLDRATSVNRGVQILLSLKYQELLREGKPLPKLEDVEFRAFSQNGEDGILHYIFSLIGTTNRRAIEIGAGSGVICNTANLIINHGWYGLLFDGNETAIQEGTEFYKRCRDTFNWPPKLVSTWIDAENINSLISSYGFDGEVDLLSLDIDGVDYWILKAIECVSPRVIILEYQDIWGPEKAVTVPYKSNFQAVFGDYGPDYAGASLGAFIKLGKEKGYRLIGCQRYGFNAFFMRNDVGVNIFPEVSPEEYFQHPKVKYGMEHRLPEIKDRPWVEV